MNEDVDVMAMSEFLAEIFTKLRSGDLRDEIKTIFLLVAIAVLTVVVFQKMTSSRNATTQAVKTTVSLNYYKPNSSNGKGPTAANNVNSQESSMQCVWEERRQKGILPPSTSTSRTDTKSNKPFGSSYYYAHMSNATGGYVDGLRTEDFAMNGPRLLSKSGKLCDEPAPTEHPSDPFQEQAVGVVDKPPPITESANIPPTSVPMNAEFFAKDITRYMWDDPGDSKGIGTILIEALPGKTSTETIAWKDVNVKSATAKLEGEGMKVLVTDENGQMYRLKISHLYDKASEVRTVIKPKRLLVKIHKKRTLSFWDKSNLTPWPHPQKKHF